MPALVSISGPSRWLLLAIVLSKACAFAQVDTPVPAAAEPAPAPPILTPVSPPAPAAELSARDALVLGLIEGITEFLPISSTGHLIIATHALKLEGTEPLRTDAGEPLWHRPPSEKYPAGQPLTQKLAADTFIVVIQVGAIAAVIILYWGQLVGMLRGVLGKNAAGVRLLRNVVLAVAPVLVAGFLLRKWIEALFSIGAVVAALVSGAVLMIGAERWRRTAGGSSRKELSDLTPRQAFSIGLMQCLALWPGMSRSMVTMVGGYFCGLSPARAAEFSFLVGIPTLTAAAVYKGANAGPAMIEVFGWEPILLGAAVAAVSAALAVRFLVSYLSRHGLGVFAIYRLVLAAALTAWFLV